MVEEALQTGIESAKVIKTLREELVAQEALREKEREQRRLAEDERRRIEEGLRKSHANNDWLKEEQEQSTPARRDGIRTFEGGILVAKGSGRLVAGSSKPTPKTENRRL